MKKNDLIQDIKNHLDQSVDTLAPKTLSKIRSARYEALHTSKSKWISLVLPLGGFSAAALAVYFAVTFISVPEMKPTSGQVEIVKAIPHGKKLEKITDAVQPSKMEIAKALPEQKQTDGIQTSKMEEVKLKPGQIELVEIITAGLQLELFENLEFYTWIAENPEETLDS